MFVIVRVRCGGSLAIFLVFVFRPWHPAWAVFAGCLRCAQLASKFTIEINSMRVIYHCWPIVMLRLFLVCIGRLPNQERGFKSGF